MSAGPREERGARLRARREAAGLTRVQLAHRANVGVDWLGRAERGEARIDDWDLPRLKRVLEREERSQRLIAAG